MKPGQLKGTEHTARSRCLERGFASIGLWAAIAAASGCGMGGGIGGELDLLGLLGGFAPTEEEVSAFEEATRQFQTEVDALPSVTVRVVNQTDTEALVQLVSGKPGPQSDEFFGVEGLIPSPYGEAGSVGMQRIDDHQFTIAPGGEATGAVKCGDVIAVSVNAPANFGTTFYDEGGAFGLFAGAGNIQFSGAGMSHDTFEGDVVGARYIQPVEDGLSCATNTVVVRIESPATAETFDSVTGELIPGGRGAGTLTIE